MNFYIKYYKKVNIFYTKQNDHDLLFLVFWLPKVNLCVRLLCTFVLMKIIEEG